jgi:hypothetical protein
MAAVTAAIRINLLFTIIAEQATATADAKPLLLPKDKQAPMGQARQIARRSRQPAT